MQTSSQPLRRPAGSPPAVVAHRGASAVAPENTAPAFAAARACGAIWIETDVQVTADLVPVLIHDEELDRTTDGTGPVTEQTAYNLATLDAGSWFGPQFAGTRIPELTELAATLGPERLLLLELKGEHSREAVLAEIEVLRAAGTDQYVLLQSFEESALRHVRGIQPDRPVGLLVEALDEDPVARCRELGAVAYNPEHTLLRGRPELVTELHAAGLAIFAWTADNPDDWQFLTGLGVDAIITDDPAALLAWQRETRCAPTDSVTGQ